VQLLQNLDSDLFDNSNAADMYNTTFDGFYFDDFKVIKQISEPPVAICKNATLALGAGGTLTVLPADVNNSTDDIGITTLSVSPNTFNCTQNTTQNVTLTVTDADGQTSTCVATVTITDHPLLELYQLTNQFVQVLNS
jgi:hypothetical protein